MNHPMGPPALETCAVADHLAHAARLLANLGFLLEVLRPGAAGRPRSGTSRCARPRALTGGAVQISGCVGHTNPGCSCRARGREILRRFSDGGAGDISRLRCRINPGVSPCVRGRGFCLGGRFGRRPPLRNFWRISLNRVRGSPRARGGFCQGFFRRQGWSGSLHPVHTQTRRYRTAYAWSKLAIACGGVGKPGRESDLRAHLIAL